MQMAVHRPVPMVASIALVLLAGIQAPSTSAWAQTHKMPDRFAQKVQGWSSPEHVHAWIKANFVYDRRRAIALSQTQRARGVPFHIYQPSELFQRRSGICVDLSRFAVDVLRMRDPGSRPRYLLIKFSPVKIAGNVLRMHWIASFQREGKYYFFADSYYPDVLSGPHESIDDFIRSYQDKRGRQIVAYRLVDTFRKKKRTMRQKKRMTKRTAKDRR